MPVIQNSIFKTDYDLCMVLIELLSVIISIELSVIHVDTDMPLGRKKFTIKGLIHFRCTCKVRKSSN